MVLFVTVLFLTVVSLLHDGTCFSVSPAERSFAPSNTGQRRGIYGPPGLMKVANEGGSSGYAAKPSSSSNPMNPFLSLRPFLPVKPTFFPPVVDPNIFINKKAQMLDSLFSSSAITDFVPNAGVSNSADMTANDSPMPQTSEVNPKDFINSKTEFLSNLFDQLSSNDGLPSTVQRDLIRAYDDTPSIQRRVVPGPSPFWGPILSPTEKIKLFTDKKTQFLDKLFTSISVTPQPETDSANVLDETSTTVKPTIVPPDFWIPQYKKPGTMQTRAMPGSVQQSIAPQPPLSWNPLISPMAKAYSDKKTDFLNKLFANVVPSPEASPQMGSAFDTINPTIKPTIVPPSFWLPAYKKSSPTAENDVAVNNPTSSVIKESDAVLPFPFAPLVNGAPVFSPTYFITKKNEFLAKLFQTLNTTNPSATGYSGSGVDTTAYPYFLAQLFDYLNYSNTGKDSAYSSPKRHSPDSEKIRVSDLEKFLRIISDNSDSEGSSTTDLFSERSVTMADPVNIQNAKDMFVNNILGELANIKNSMLQAASEVVQQQKLVSTSPASGKKPGTTYGSPYKMWGKAAAGMPTADPLQPFVTKMTYLSHLFDTLTQLEKNMTSAIEQEAALGAQKSTDNEVISNNRRGLSGGVTNSDLAALQLCGANGELPLTELTSLTNEPATADTLTSDNLLNKSKKLFCHLLAKAGAGKQKGNGVPSTEPVARSIKMAVHQGYQSLPPGTEELLQAGGGGGGETQNQEGGGLKLQKTGLDYGQEQWSSHHHHNHHH
ncbi:uncharacterized protein LOC124615799 isoform X1 [Schistocerca americana]|uniref:uncharacterized protein LOC124615799 isoform X1 n=1 Tax=Schistocerca americana TaxID=7009 RepID=UPI001F4F1FAE|nr:uncharacterized protein LOC124615799 isoform X1 [Schistocerca americana]